MAPRNTHNVVLELLLKRMSSGRVLDIPCGSMPFAKRLVSAGFQVAALDIVEQEATPGVDFQVADMDERLSFGDAMFDAVTSIEGIEHIRRPFDFIRECHRVLRPGGYLFVTTPNISALRSRWRWFLTGFHHKCKAPLDETRPAPRHHVHMVSFPELRYMLHTTAFRLEHVTTNRIKPINWLYLPCVPLQYLMSRLAFARAAKDNLHRSVMADVRRQMLSGAILFGESIVVVALKE